MTSTPDNINLEIDVEERPPLVFQFEHADGSDYLIIPDQGRQLIEELEALALTVEVDGIYALRKTRDKLYEWYNVHYEEPTLRSVKKDGND